MRSVLQSIYNYSHLKLHFKLSSFQDGQKIQLILIQFSMPHEILGHGEAQISFLCLQKAPINLKFQMIEVLTAAQTLKFTLILMMQNLRIFHQVLIHLQPILGCSRKSKSFLTAHLKEKIKNLDLNWEMIKLFCFCICLDWTLTGTRENQIPQNLKRIYDWPSVADKLYKKTVRVLITDF